MARLGSAALFLAAFIWGTSFVMMKDVSEKLPPSFLLAIRFTLGALILSVIFAKRLKKLDKTYIFPGILIGAFLFTAYLVQTYGLIGTTPGKNAFLTASYCVITPFLFWLVSKKRPDRFHVISACICLLGIFLISVDLSGENLLTVATGDILTLICGFFYAAHIVAISMTADKKDPMLITVLQFAVAAVLSWITYFIQASLGIAEITAVSGDFWGIFTQILYLSFFCTAAALGLQNFGQKYAHPASASVILTFEAVFGALFSLILGAEEGFTVWRGLGFVLMFAAVIISETKLSFLKKKDGKKQMEIPPIMNTEDAIKLMYEKNLRPNVIKSIYNKDKNKRYLLYRKENGFITYTFEELYLFDDEEEWYYVVSTDGEALPGYWSSLAGERVSLFASEEDALRELMHDSEYLAYFVDNT